MSYYPRPAVQAVYPTTNPRRSHAPLETPPVIPRHQLPRLPSLPRTQTSLPQSLSQTHTLTTHIVTAAFPRTPSELLVRANYAPPPDESKQARKERVQNIYKTFSHKKRRQEKGLPVGQPRREVLYNVFNRYARKGRMDPNGLTLVVTHAVGFPKEVGIIYIAFLCTYLPNFVTYLYAVDLGAGIRTHHQIHRGSKLWGSGE